MTPRKTLTAAYWPEPIAIISQVDSPQGFITIEAVGLETRRHYTTALPLDAWEALKPEEPAFTFDAPAGQFRLALEGERLRAAHTADPLLAANNARVHLLPHQMEAVYGVMLPQPRIRYLMAHDAGAGKTIMAGLLFRELVSRDPGMRTLIVAPAALTAQWQRELEEKFLVRFDVVERDQLKLDTQVWTESNRLITSMPFARQADVQATLANVRWDLVIVDEAHHMAGYEKRQTQAYHLGRLLSRNTKHLVLATATPHKGDRANFLKLLQLLDPGIHDPDIVNQRAPGQRGNPLMLRRLKEEMVDFADQPLFKPRQIKTMLHRIEENPPELDLYTALTEYVAKTYRAAERVGGRVKVNTQFAMVILQRRMASSFTALEHSLHRRRNAVLQVADAPAVEFDWSELEEQAEATRWKQEQQAELATPALTKQEREKEAAQLDDLLAKLAAVRESGIETKVRALQKIMVELEVTPVNGEKLLVFTEFKDTLDFLRELFVGWGHTVTQIDGSMPQVQRRQAEADFREHCQVMVATEAAGEGINLQFCARMVNYDLPWVPTRLEQRMGRIHRYGQQRVAHIVNLTAADTREGRVLLGLMERLDEMRQHMGDQVFDVISTLVSDDALERLLARVATAPMTEASHDAALQEIIQLIRAAEAHHKAWEEHPFAISAAVFREMQQASRQSRLTPEYAQNFFVDVLKELKESPASLPDAEQSPGDAPAFALTLQRQSVATALSLPAHRQLLFTFREAEIPALGAARFLALGAPTFERALQLAGERWGEFLRRGAVFVDVELPPGAAYLLWFLAAQVRDGNDQRVQEVFFAVKQSAEGMEAAPAAALIDLIPAPVIFDTPQTLREWALDAGPALEWSISRQQLPMLIAAQQNRAWITDLRREPMLFDAAAAIKWAQAEYELVAFTDDEAARQAAQRLRQTKERLRALERQFERETACSLGPARLVGAAAVLSLLNAPEGDLVDEKPDIAAAAEKLAREYEEKHGRLVKVVSGEHHDYPYDLHSTGPGGLRCIEVKGTTTGHFMLSENQRRAARRLGSSYYVYIVSDPLGAQPRLAIVRDPLAGMQYDSVLYSGARYVYKAATWRAAAEEEVAL